MTIPRCRYFVRAVDPAGRHGTCDVADLAADHLAVWSAWAETAADLKPFQTEWRTDRPFPHDPPPDPAKAA